MLTKQVNLLKLLVAGTFQASTGQSSCDDADPGHYVDQPGQSTQTACLAGTYNPNTGSTTPTDCLGADPGHYVDSLGTGQSTQTACLAGTYNPNTGSTINRLYTGSTTSTA